MPAPRLNYPQLVEMALRGVIRELLADVAENGLPGEHHFYLTFRTNDPGVVLPSELRQQYPDEMTIVLQHQFRDLTIDHDCFSVVLRFSGAEQRVEIPFASLTAFADPSASFGLQFRHFSEVEEALEGPRPLAAVEALDEVQSEAAVEPTESADISEEAKILRFGEREVEERKR